MEEDNSTGAGNNPATGCSPFTKGESNNDLPSLIRDKVSSGKNNTKLRCERCSSLVLSPGMAKYVTKKVKYNTGSALYYVV